MERVTPGERHAAVAATSCLLVLTALVLLSSAAPLYTDDLWWHLKAGETYATEGPWPAADPMLHTALEAAPIQHEWLFGVVVHEVRAVAGFHGLRLLHVLAVVGIVWLAWSCLRHASAMPALGAFATCVFVALAWARLDQLRPDLVTIPAALLGYRLLMESGRAPSWGRVCAFAVLVAVWANAHSLFLVGINLLVAALLGIALDAVLGWLLVRPPLGVPSEPRLDGSLAARWLCALPLALLVSLANPRGIEQHLAYFSATASSAIWHVTDEWSPFNPFVHAANHPSVTLAIWVLADLVLVWFVAIAAVRFVGVVARRDGAALDDFAAVRFGLALAGVVAALVSIRFLWMLVFALMYVQPRAGAREGARRVRAATLAAWLAALASLAVTGWFSVDYGFATLLSRFSNTPAEYLKLPYRSHKYYRESVHFLQASGVEGNLYNPYWMGGFAGYWLSPRLRTFIDGRTEHYGTQVFREHAAIQNMASVGDEPFTHILDRRGVDLFVGVGFPGWWYGVYTTPHLEGVPGWTPVSRGYRHAVYLRVLPRNRENLERIGAWYARQGVPFDSIRGLDPGQVIRERPDWAMQHGMLPRDYPSVLEAASGGDARAERATERLAVIYLLNGAYDLQVELDRGLARVSGEAGLRARQRLVYAALRRGQIEEAAAAARELQALAPEASATKKLADLVARFAEVQGGRNPASLEVGERLYLNRLLWQAAPVRVAETWAIEHTVDTETLPLTPP